MNVHIAIVEDDDAQAATLEEYIRRYGEESVEIAEDYAAGYDVIFLDVQMKLLDGMETAKRIRRLDKEVLIVFVTNMAQYAIKGYAVDALNFLLKPVPYFVFCEELKRCIEKLKSREKHFLMLNTEDGVLRVCTDDIAYIEVLNHRLYIYTEEREIRTYGTIKDMETKLPPQSFFRANNCYLINLAYVSGVREGMAIVGKKELAISRAKKKGFMEALAEYYRRKNI